MKLVAIHQPNFFPWLGYFDKIAKADVFIFMDNVQFQKTGGTWTNRVNLLVNGKPHLITCPVLRPSGMQMINQVVINEHVPWRKKCWGTIKYNYSGTLAWEENSAWVEELLLNPESNLARYNMHAIKTICRYMAVEAEFVIASEIAEFKERATDLLIAMVQSVGGDAYLCGGGASAYQEDWKFEEKGLKLKYQNFVHPKYDQYKSKEFIPGLSILDLIFNSGKHAAFDIIHRHDANKLANKKLS